MESGQLVLVFPTSMKTTVTVPACAVEIGDGEGDPLALLVDPEDDELSGLGLPGDYWGRHLEEVDPRGEILSEGNLDTLAQLLRKCSAPANSERKPSLSETM